MNKYMSIKNLDVEIFHAYTRYYFLENIEAKQKMRTYKNMK